MGPGVESSLHESLDLSSGKCEGHRNYRLPILPFPSPSLLFLFLMLLAKLLLFFKGFYMHECFACSFVRVPCACNFCGDQRRRSDPLELEREMATRQHGCREVSPGALPERVGALKHGAISPAPQYYHLHVLTSISRLGQLYSNTRNSTFIL